MEGEGGIGLMIEKQELVVTGRRSHGWWGH